MTTRDEIYYDPYDPELQLDPYPVFRRMREEAPLYYNDRHDYAVSRSADVESALKDHGTFSSAQGGILELIKADIELPSGVFIFEDPPIHTAHRGILSRIFTPRKMNALEPFVRDLCAEVLDPLVGADRLDFVGDLGARMPMRVIGALLGIPVQDQEDVRQHKDDTLRRARPARGVQRGSVRRRRVLRRLHRLAHRQPVRRPDDVPHPRPSSRTRPAWCAASPTTSCSSSSTCSPRPATRRPTG